MQHLGLEVDKVLSFTGKRTVNAFTLMVNVARAKDKALPGWKWLRSLRLTAQDTNFLLVSENFAGLGPCTGRSLWPVCIWDCCGRVFDGKHQTFAKFYTANHRLVTIAEQYLSSWASKTSTVGQQYYDHQVWRTREPPRQIAKAGVKRSPEMGACLKAKVQVKVRPNHEALHIEEGTIKAPF
jgi:hypothetical protein